MEHRLATSASPMEVCSVSIDFHRRFYLTSCGLFQSGIIPEAGIGTGTWQWNIQHFSNSGGSSADFWDTFPTASLCFSQNGFRGWPQNTANKTGFQSMVSIPYDPMEIRLSATSARRRKVDQGYGRDGSNWWLSWNPLWGVDMLDPNLCDCWVTWC